MDLFEPVKDQNNFGARTKKNVSCFVSRFLIELLSFEVVRKVSSNVVLHCHCIPLYSLQLKSGKIGSNSYVPAGLSAAEYQKIRDRDEARKAANYAKNNKKAGIYEDFTEFYTKRGTDTSQAWAKSTTRGHRMAKTKYDLDTAKFGKKWDGSL